MSWGGRQGALPGGLGARIDQRFQISQWLRAIRVHHYIKNGLVFLPLLAAQEFSWASFAACLGAFIAFCLAASSVYLLNDIMDLQADRAHATKRLRPLASGALSTRNALMAAVALALAAAIAGTVVTWSLAGIVASYLAIGLLYSIYIKRKMIADVVTLAGLYVVRILGGAVAIGVTPSQWLLAFSMFLFLSLAFVKRYSELVKRRDDGLAELENRNYKFSDAPIVGAVAAASGMNAVTVLALYVASEQVQALYSHPWLLYLICPVLIYWIGRVLLMANRGLLDDDPVVFASRDFNSRLSGLIILAVVLGAN